MSKKRRCQNTDCQKLFAPVNWFQRFCTSACRLKAWRKKKQEAKS